LTHPTGDTLSTLALSGRPYGVTTNADGVALVSRMDNDAVTRIDLATLAVGTTIGVGRTPFWVSFAPSGSTAFVANHYGQSIGEIDLATNNLVATVPITGDPLTVVVSPDGSRVYATNNGSSLFVIDPATRRVIKMITVSLTPYGMAFHPTQPILYVGGRDGQTVSLVDTRTNVVTGEMMVGGRPHNIVVSPDGTELYVANEAGSLDVFSLTTNLRTHSLPIGPAHGMAMSPDGAQLYVSMPSAGMVAIIDRVTKKAVQVIFTRGRPRKVAFSATGNVALITNEGGWVDIVR
jgi:YVTN family beta-propeller protein